MRNLKFMKIAQSTHRKDIQGLRAIAALLVFFFHLELTGFDGGFIGVDVFYVISGYVIFRGLVENPELFSTTDFYKKRITRILPALLFITSVSLLAGLIILTPTGLESLAKQAASAMLSLSNIYFLDTSDYFSPGAYNLPLLHTWSLGIEEQFYILTPLFMFAAKKRAHTLLIVLVITISFSFALEIYLTYLATKPEYAFYFPIARFWEIGIGALAACQSKSISASKSKVMEWLGISGLIFSLAFIESEDLFPGFLAALPVGSTMLILMSRTQSLATRKFLSAKPMQFIGKISYSLYLVHWPLIVYCGMLTGRALNFPEKILLLGIGLILAYMMFTFIEQPFRNGAITKTWKKKQIILAAWAGLIGIVSAIIISTQGLPQRLTGEASFQHAQMKKNQEIGHCHEFQAFSRINQAKSCIMREGVPDFILWGDSHAGMLWPKLAESAAYAKLNGAIITMPDCNPIIDTITNKKKNRENCLALGSLLINYLRDHKVPALLVASRWARLYAPVPSPGDHTKNKELFYYNAPHERISLREGMQHSVTKVIETGTRMIIIGPVPEVPYDVPEMLIRSKMLGTPMPTLKKADYLERQRYVITALHAIGSMATIVWPHKILCKNQLCDTIKDNIALYSDDDHLSEEGAKLLAPSIMEAILNIKTSHHDSTR